MRGARQSARTSAPGSVNRRLTELWGVLNITPDSFSDGGRFVRDGLLDLSRAVAAGLEMVSAGAAVVDVGGESSRPAGQTYGTGAAWVRADEEVARVAPVVSELARRGVPVSVDTVKPEVAWAAIDAGARIINDVSGGASDALLEVVAERGVELVLMHTRGRGEVAEPNTVYGDVAVNVRDELADKVERAVRCGVERERIWLDPGLGFAKTPAQSLEILRCIDTVLALGHRVLIGPSRKAFIGWATAKPDGAIPGPTEREPGTAVTVAHAVSVGVDAVRVHDVPAMWQAREMARALRGGGGSREVAPGENEARTMGAQVAARDLGARQDAEGGRSA